MTVAADPALAAALRLAVVRLARRLRRERAESALSLSALSALTTLEAHGPMAPGELAAHEGVRPPSLTRVLSGLEEAGLATRVPHPSDGRQVVVAASPQGRALLEEDRRRRDAWLDAQLRDLPAEDLDLLRRAAALLDRLAAR